MTAAQVAREAKWADLDALETAVVAPYVAFTKLTDAQWLQQLGDNAQSVLHTNSQLQEELFKQEQMVRNLRRQLKVREQEYAQLQEQLLLGKSEQAQVEAKLRSVREQRVAEERRLRDQGVSLYNRLGSLAQENLRLEGQRHDEEVRIERNRSLLSDLRSEAARLEMRKAEFEGNHSRSGSDAGSDACWGPGVREAYSSKPGSRAASASTKRKSLTKPESFGRACNCGNTLVPDALFCRKCGEKVSQAGLGEADRGPFSTGETPTGDSDHGSPQRKGTAEELHNIAVPSAPGTGRPRRHPQ